MRRRTLGSSPFEILCTSKDSKKTFPEEGFSSAKRSFKSVDLPAPDCPTIETNSCGSTAKETASSGADGAGKTKFQIFLAKFHFGGRNKLGHHFHQRERGVPALIGVKRRDADQTVHSGFFFKIAVSVSAANLGRGV